MKKLLCFICALICFQLHGDDMENPQVLYKIISEEQWQESQKDQKLCLSQMDQEFIHLATESQVTHVVQKFWKDKSYIKLTLDPKKLQGRLVYETNPGGSTKYYHLYEGCIPLSAVIEITKS